MCQSEIVNSKEPNSRLSIREKKAINKNYSKLGHYPKKEKKAGNYQTSKPIQDIKPQIASFARNNLNLSIKL